MSKSKEERDLWKDFISQRENLSNDKRSVDTSNELESERFSKLFRITDDLMREIDLLWRTTEYGPLQVQLSNLNDALSKVKINYKDIFYDIPAEELTPSLYKDLNDFYIKRIKEIIEPAISELEKCPGKTLDLIDSLMNLLKVIGNLLGTIATVGTRNNFFSYAEVKNDGNVQPVIEATNQLMNNLEIKEEGSIEKEKDHNEKGIVP